jgi:hypothetical protein
MMCSGITLPTTLPGLTLPKVSTSSLLQLASNLGLQAAEAAVSSATGINSAVATVDSLGLKDVVAQWLAGGTGSSAAPCVLHCQLSAAVKTKNANAGNAAVILTTFCAQIVLHLMRTERAPLRCHIHWLTSTPQFSMCFSCVFVTAAHNLDLPLPKIIISNVTANGKDVPALMIRISNNSVSASNAAALVTLHAWYQLQVCNSAVNPCSDSACFHS